MTREKLSEGLEKTLRNALNNKYDNFKNYHEIFIVI